MESPWEHVAGRVMTIPEKAPRSPRFEPGTKVRVRYGVTAPDYGDIPLGGWTGTIQGSEQTDDQIDIEIEWDRETLHAMHPVYRKRCERDDLEPETMWLKEADVEPDDGTAVPIEQPTEIKTPPLSESDQDDRVRKALGLTHDDPLPAISLVTLLTYHRSLTARLKFPFDGYCGDEEVGPFSRKRIKMTVTGLLDPDREGLNLEDGLVCMAKDRDGEVEITLAEIEVRKKDPNFKLVSDYAYWFRHWPIQQESDLDRDDDLEIESEFPPPSRWLYIKAVLVFGVGSGILGATIGAALETFHGARLAAMIGGIPLAMFGASIMGWYGITAGARNRLHAGALLGAVLGSLVGGLIGVVAGLTIVALPWSGAGLLAGMFSGPYVLPQKVRRLVSFRGALLGTCGGVLISAFRHDQARATAGAASGAITGLVVGAGLVLLLLGAVYRITRASTGDDEDVEESEK